MNACELKKNETVLKQGSPRRVLLYAESWAVGGIEAYIMTLIRNLPSDYVELVVFTVHNQVSPFDNELRSKKITRYNIFDGYKPNQITRLTAGLNKFSKIIDKLKPDVVHINTMNGMGFTYSWIAKRKGVPTRIVHSHNSDVGEGHKILKRVAGALGRVLFGRTANIRLACSKVAGQYLFGNASFEIVRNGIDTNRFTFSQSKRVEVRNELGISNSTLLFGNPSRLSRAKNPLFQLEIFAEILKIQPDARYLMLSSGDMVEEVLQNINRLGIEKSIILVNSRSDPESWYSALDVLVFPSIFEGMPIVPVEAQCSGLPVVLSNTISSEVGITNLCSTLSLDVGPAVWSECAVQQAKRHVNRTSYSKVVREAGFDSMFTVERIKEIYQMRK